MMFDLKVKSYSAHTEDINVIADCIEEAMGIMGFKVGPAIKWCLEAKPGDRYDNDGIHIRASESRAKEAE